MNDLTTQFMECIQAALKPIKRRLDALDERADKLADFASESLDRGFVTESTLHDVVDTSHGKASAFAMDEIAKRDEVIEQLQDDVASLKAHIENMPEPKDGKDAEPVSITDVGLALEGMRGAIMDEARAAAMANIPDPDDIIQAIEDGYCAKWALEFERRAQDTLQRAIDRMPAPKDGVDGKDGKDGVDGMGFDDIDVVYEGDGQVTIKMVRGDRNKSFQFQLPCMVDAGVFREGHDYKMGNVVSHGGSMWIAQKDHPQGRPGQPDTDWRLSVKKGRDGRDGRDGKDGARGPAGRDATVLDMVKPETKA